LTAKQQKLPAIYGENLRLICALEKCRFWLRGCPWFVIRTDQQALQQIYNQKPLEEISDEISNIVVCTYRYNF